MRQFYLSVISGQKRGPLASSLRGVLWLGTFVYAALHGSRSLFYRMGLFRSVRFPCPVVSVGNITAGGTGKTPFVEFLAKWFARKNYRTAILARGYGKSRGSETDDEDLISGMELENVVRLAGPNRVPLGRKALDEYRADLLILDDGFQHFRIQRTLDLVTIDATNPFAGGKLLPSGLLRERTSALKRAGLIVLTRTDQVTPGELETLRAQVGPAVETVHRPVSVRSLSSRKRYGTEWLREKSVFVFCGIGNPEAFRQTVISLGAKIVKFRTFTDHYPYVPQDVQRLNAEAEEFMADVILTTEKDASKLDLEGFHLPLMALRVEIEITRNEDLLEERLLEVVRDIPRVTAPIGN